MDKIPCKECGTLILPTTFEKNNGRCLLCVRGIKKEFCELCSFESTVLTNVNGKKVCLKCNMKLSEPIVERWKNSCSPTSNIFDIESLEVKPYPEFEEVFEDNNLKGFFFPLCSLIYRDKKSDINRVFHVLSHNGLWLDESKSTFELNENFSVFEIKLDKYQFNGSITSFKGYDYVKNLFAFLIKHFEDNTTSYLNTKFTSADFVKHIQANYFNDLTLFDSEYYLESFFTYHKQKFNFKNQTNNNNFLPIKDFKNLNLFTAYNEKDFINVGEEIIINEKYFKITANLIEKTPIGVCWVDEYFQDGNNIFAFYDDKNKYVYFVNQYS